MRQRFNSPASRLFAQPFIQAQIKENIKASRHWIFTDEKMAINAENVSIWLRHHIYTPMVCIQLKRQDQSNMAFAFPLPEQKFRRHSFYSRHVDWTNGVINIPPLPLDTIASMFYSRGIFGCVDYCYPSCSICELQKWLTWLLNMYICIYSLLSYLMNICNIRVT